MVSGYSGSGNIHNKTWNSRKVGIIGNQAGTKFKSRRGNPDVVRGDRRRYQCNASFPPQLLINFREIGCGAFKVIQIRFLP